MEKNKKHKISVIIASIILTMILIVGASYAYFSSRVNTSKKSVTAGNVRVTYQDNTDSVSVSNIVPIKDDDIKTKANKFSFKITNTGTIASYSSISIVDIAMDNELANLEFKWALYDGDTKISNGNFRNVYDNKLLLTNNIKLNSNANKDYQLYIWISESGIDQSNLMNKSFSAKIKVDSNMNEATKLLSTVIIENNPVNTTTPDFNTIAETDEGLFKDSDKDGDTYYFRGDVKDNYVKINGLKWNNSDIYYINGTNGTTELKYVSDSREDAESDCSDAYEIAYGYTSSEECINDIKEGGHNTGDDILFKIVRVNGDGTIRVITDRIGESEFNSLNNNPKYVGYTYDNSKPNVQDGTSSTIKTYLDNWYDTNIKNNSTNKECDKYFASTRYCNDTTIGETSGNYTHYGAYTRNYSNKMPSFGCGLTNQTYGGEYDLKIGLLTHDEMAFAGIVYGAGFNNYLPFGFRYWTGSPFFYGNAASELHVDTDGTNGNFVNDTVFVVPVFNLNADVLYTGGDGTIDNPYTITLD